MHRGGIVAIGGPALTWYLSPTSEQLFEKFSPEIKKRNLELRHEREKGFDDFVTKLKAQSKSSKPSREASLASVTREG